MGSWFTDSYRFQKSELQPESSQFLFLSLSQFQFQFHYAWLASNLLKYIRSSKKVGNKKKNLAYRFFFFLIYMIWLLNMILWQKTIKLQSHVFLFFLIKSLIYVYFVPRHAVLMPLPSLHNGGMRSNRKQRYIHLT